MRENATKREQAAAYIRARFGERPQAAIVLGSGETAFADRVEQPVRMPYAEIPGFVPPGVAGHGGELVCGRIAGKAVLVFVGRTHFYEGRSMEQIVHPIRTAAALGAKQALFLNAAGGICPDFRPGDLMLIEDHINLTGQNPLIGENDDDLGPRFPDMSAAYSRRMMAVADVAAAKEGFALQRGVYLWTTGPSYETPAEIRFFRTIGADAVGMSTVPEVIAARHAGMEVLGLSLITNRAAGMGNKLSHEEVLEAAAQGSARIGALIENILSLL